MSTKPKRTDMNLAWQVKTVGDQQLITPLPPGQFMLLQALITLNNKCGWLEEFTVALSVLETFTCLSRAGVQKARRALINKGYIEFKSNGTQAGTYKLFKLYEENSSIGGTTNAHSEVASSTTSSTRKSNSNVNESTLENSDMTGKDEVFKNTSTQAVSGECKQDDATDIASSNTSSTTNSTSLTKLNKTKLNKTKQSSSGLEQEMGIENSSAHDDIQAENVFEFYQKNFGILAPFVQEDMLYWIQDIGHELVLEALKRTLERNKKYSYAKSIMQSWVEKGVDTLEKAMAERVQHIRSFDKKTSSYQRTGRVAPMPDRYNNQNETKETKLSPEEEQKIREQLNALRGVAK